jgi:hypothetical protein
MVVVIVTFPNPGSPPEGSRALLEATAPAYREVPGLRRKYFIGNPETAGGIYEWIDRMSADVYFDAQWRSTMLQRYGVKPEVTYFDAPCLVDNVTNETLLEG